MKVIIRDAAGRAGPGRKDSRGNGHDLKSQRHSERPTACEFGFALMQQMKHS